jgi:threonine aldolase
VYSIDEVAALTRLAHDRGLLVHMDGARLSNAAAVLGCSLRALTTDAGVDVVSFGGTKNGLLGAEAVVFLNAGLAEGFQWLRKQSLQLASKMRFLAAQFEALLSDELWRTSAAHANALASRLADSVRDLPGLQITHPVEANAVFATVPHDSIALLREQFDFYVWDEARDEVRWMCSWDTTDEDVERFAGAVRDALGA